MVLFKKAIFLTDRNSVILDFILDKYGYPFYNYAIMNKSMLFYFCLLSVKREWNCIHVYFGNCCMDRIKLIYTVSRTVGAFSFSYSSEKTCLIHAMYSVAKKSKTANKTLLKIKILLSFIFLLHHLICRKRWEYAARYGFIPAALYDKSRESIKPLAAFPLFLYGPQIIMTRPAAAGKEGGMGRSVEGWNCGTSGLWKVRRVFVRMKIENTYDIIFLFLLITILNYGRSTNSGEPAAVVGFNLQRMSGILLLPKSTAAGLLFPNEPSPHYPNPPTPHLHKTLHTPKTRINISIANYKIRRTPHVRS